MDFSGIGARSRSSELRASRGVRLSISRLSCSIIWTSLVMFQLNAFQGGIYSLPASFLLLRCGFILQQALMPFQAIKIASTAVSVAWTAISTTPATV